MDHTGNYHHHPHSTDDGNEHSQRFLPPYMMIQQRSKDWTSQQQQPHGEQPPTFSHPPAPPLRPPGPFVLIGDDRTESFVSAVTLHRDVLQDMKDEEDIPSKLYVPTSTGGSLSSPPPRADADASVGHVGRYLQEAGMEQDQDLERYRILMQRYQSLKAQDEDEEEEVEEGGREVMVHHDKDQAYHAFSPQGNDDDKPSEQQYPLTQLVRHPNGNNNNSDTYGHGNDNNNNNNNNNDQLLVLAHGDRNQLQAVAGDTKNNKSQDVHYHHDQEIQTNHSSAETKPRVKVGGGSDNNTKTKRGVSFSSHSKTNPASTKSGARSSSALVVSNKKSEKSEINQGAIVASSSMPLKPTLSSISNNHVGDQASRSPARETMNHNTTSVAIMATTSERADEEDDIENNTDHLETTATSRRRRNRKEQIRLRVLTMCSCMVGVALTMAVLVLLNWMDVSVFGYDVEFQPLSSLGNQESALNAESDSKNPTGQPSTIMIPSPAPIGEKTPTNTRSPSTPAPSLLPSRMSSPGEFSGSPSPIASIPTSSPAALSSSPSIAGLKGMTPTQTPFLPPTSGPLPSKSPTTEGFGSSMQPEPSTRPTIAPIQRSPTITPTKTATEVPSNQPIIPDRTPIPSFRPTKQPTRLSTIPGPISTPTLGPAPSSTPVPALPTTTAAPTPIPSTNLTPPPASAPSAGAWDLVAGPFSGTGLNSGHGTSVALAGGYLVVSEPSVASVGQVRVYRENPLPWTVISAVVDVNAMSFGSAVDMAIVSRQASLLVGAKDSNDASGLAKFGSAAYYEIDNEGSWTLVGSVQTPGTVLFDAGGEFGGAVAMASTIRRYAVAAPESSANSTHVKTGKVYTYEYGSGGDWEQMARPLIGEVGSKLGSSIDMAIDGTALLAGAPQGQQGDGAVYYYKWDEATITWKEGISLPGGTGEALGTSVAIISNDGGTIAFGGPSYNTSYGVIRVYKDLGGFFVQLGSDIVGTEGQQIGRTLCGSKGTLAFGTSTGSFHVYQYNDGDWVEVATGPSTGSSVVSIAMSDDQTTVVVGLQDQTTQVYKLQ
ncbi:hypothetical protein ACA910_005768 [Epithemia clementina (nom. ined.)]